MILSDAERLRRAKPRKRPLGLPSLDGPAAFVIGALAASAVFWFIVYGSKPVALAIRAWWGL